MSINFNQCQLCLIDLTLCLSTHQLKFRPLQTAQTTSINYIELLQVSDANQARQATSTGIKRKVGLMKGSMFIIMIGMLVFVYLCISWISLYILDIFHLIEFNALENVNR